MENYEYTPSNGTPTSDAAACKMSGARASKIGAKLMAYMQSRGDYGATLQEAELDTGISGNTIRPRMLTLRKRGQVVDAEKYRKTLDGNNAVVWKVAPSEDPKA
jgi:hypothetical protein